jgi:hypothetical protein
VATPFCYRKVFFRVEEEVRSRVEAKIAEQFPKLKVSLRSAHLTADGIEGRGLSISEPDAPGPQPEIVYFDEIFLACRTSVQELLSGETAVTSVKIIRPVIRETRRPDGSSSLAKLFPLPKPKRRPPPVTVEDGMVVVFDPLKNPSSTFTCRDIHLTIKPVREAHGDRMLLELKGYLAADQAQRIEVGGTIDPSGPRWALSGTVDGLALSPELRAALPQRVSDPLAVLASLRAQANLKFRVTSVGPDALPQFDVKGSVTHGQIEDRRLPSPLTDVKAEIHCDNAGYQIRDLTARHGQTTWAVAQFDRQGYAAESPLVAQISGRQVHLDSKWAAALREPWKTDWKNFDPEGDVDVDGTVAFDGQKWKPKLTVKGLNNVSFSCHRFPYRLERAGGTLALDDNVLDVAITAHSGPQPVTIKGQILNPGPQFTGKVEIQAERIPFDDKLYAALLKPKSRDTLRSLNPHGTFNVHATLWRDDPRVREMHQFLQIALSGCTIKYDKFRYELANVEGPVEMRDGQWQFPKLVGTNGTAIVTLAGGLATSPEADVLRVQVHAVNVPLQEELRAALPRPSHRELWDSLQPHGKIDVAASVVFDSRSGQTEVELRAFPRDDAAPLGTSIEPVSLPYRMRILGGSVHYHEGHVTLEKIHATHRNVELRTKGTCDFFVDGGWQMQLRDLTLDRVQLHGEDRELESALPGAIKRAIAELRPRGPLNLKGAIDLAKQNPADPLRASWDVDLFLYKAGLQVGPTLENISGRIRLTGSSHGTRYASRGELDLDSLAYKNFQFSQIIGPLWFDNSKAMLGDWGPQPGKSGQRNRRVTANVLGGVLAADCLVELGALPHYQLSATLSQADLREFARDNLTSHQKLDGKVLANINLVGKRRPESLFGSGTIHLSDANVYELPLMVSLLKIARAKPPDATAFTQSDIAFDIRGEHVILNQINLNGDAINLSGRGELTLDGQTNPINLQLYTKVGRGNVPLLTGVLSKASEQIMTIHVDGTLDHPVTRTEAFPAANQALQQLQANPEQPAGAQQTGGLMWPFAPRR